MCWQNMIKVFSSFLFISVLWTVRSEEYFGVPLGDLKNNTFGISGKAYLVNSTTIQILNFNLKEVPKLHARFAVSSEHQVAMINDMYEVENGKNNFKYLKLAEASNMTTFKDANLILRLPKSINKEKWKFFGVVSEQKWAYLAATPIDNKITPNPFCCLPPLNGWIYSVKSDPIEVLDLKTLRIPKFSFDGNKPPDGWFFVGNGAVDKKNGEKCSIRGRDTKGLQCPMREPYKEKDLIIELPNNLTLHDVSWLSVYCYEVGVDFGHIEFKISKASQPLPPVLPLLREEDSKILKGWPTVKLIAVPEPGQKLTDLTFAMGPPGGAKAKVFRGTCENLEKVWYVQGMMQPEVWVIRGATYRLKIFGGQEDPFYLTSEKTGGWSQKSESDKKNVTIYAGADGSVVGDTCSYHPIDDRRAKDPDSFEDFDEYSHFLSLDCPNRQRPYELTWVADAGSLNDLYYASYTQYYLGGKIRICDKVEGSATTMPKCIRFKSAKHVL